MTMNIEKRTGISDKELKDALVSTLDESDQKFFNKLNKKEQKKMVRESAGIQSSKWGRNFFQKKAIK